MEQILVFRRADNYSGIYPPIDRRIRGERPERVTDPCGFLLCALSHVMSRDHVQPMGAKEPPKHSDGPKIKHDPHFYHISTYYCHGGGWGRCAALGSDLFDAGIRASSRIAQRRVLCCMMHCQANISKTPFTPGKYPLLST